MFANLSKAALKSMSPSSMVTMSRALQFNSFFVLILETISVTYGKVKIII